MDRIWIEDNYKWLIQVFGYPTRRSNQILINDKYFPRTFSSKELNIQYLIDDLCTLTGLDSSLISFELHRDLRDVYGMPYSIDGKPFETEIEIGEHGYSIHIAQSLTNLPNRLIYNLIYEFIKIRLIESKLEFDTGEDTGLFIFIAGIYFGFGIPLAQNLTETGRQDDGIWETKWNYISDMPYEVMAFGLAAYSILLDQEDPEWKNELPKELVNQFDAAINALRERPLSLFNKAELEAADLFRQADEEYANGKYESAISTLQKILFLTEDEFLRADVHNNIGYYQIRSGEYEKSIANFQKAIQLDSNYGFAYDNLGYALILTGKIEEGKDQLEKALRTENNDDTYTYRNFGLYYHAKNELEIAEDNFKLAFKSQTAPVDLLEYHYAELLFAQGRTVEAMKYLEKAVKKGEPEAIKMFESIYQKHKE